MLYNRLMDDIEPKGERIAKRMATAGVCSRREAERWIEAGRVAVNGETLTTPAFLVTAADVVTVDGLPIGGQQAARLFLYHKPRGQLCTERDPQGRPTIFAALPPTLPRVVSVGRLDYDSEGLLLLTTDGQLAQDLMRGNDEREYEVTTKLPLTEGRLNTLRKGITVDGEHFAPMTVTALGNNTYQFILTEGKNREIRRAVDAIGGKVLRLKRLRYGAYVLGDLGVGGVVEVAA
ncbi:MAG: pseudouridine synthase [Alphaproteobacteria bacterium]